MFHSFSASGLNGEGWFTSSPDHFTPEKFYMRPGGPQGWSGRGWREANLFRPGSLIPVSILYTDSVIPAPVFSYLLLQINSLYSAVTYKCRV
jgi:hypothetical protein